MTGEELRQARTSLRMTQQHLGETLDVPRNTIARWERNEVTIEHATMLRLAIERLMMRECSNEDAV